LLLLNLLLSLRDATLTLCSAVDYLILAYSYAKLQPLVDTSDVYTALLFDVFLSAESFNVLLEEVDGGVCSHFADFEAEGRVVHQALNELLAYELLRDLPEELVCALLADLLSRIPEYVEHGLKEARVLEDGGIGKC